MSRWWSRPASAWGFREAGRFGGQRLAQVWACCESGLRTRYRSLIVLERRAQDAADGTGLMEFPDHTGCRNLCTSCCRMRDSCPWPPMRSGFPPRLLSRPASRLFVEQGVLCVLTEIHGTLSATCMHSQHSVPYCSVSFLQDPRRASDMVPFLQLLAYGFLPQAPSSPRAGAGGSSCAGLPCVPAEMPRSHYIAIP